MEQKSFEQLYRMLNLINHKQVNKVNIKEAIKKANRSGILIKEEETHDVDFDLGFDFHDSVIEKETDQLVKNGSDPKFYANAISSKVNGSSRAFDMPYRMYLLRFPYGKIQLKVNKYNSTVDDSHKIQFNYDENSWIKSTRESKVSLGTIGIPGRMTEIGKYILEFMSRIYADKLNPIESSFESAGNPVFTTSAAQKMAEDFIRSWLDKVVFHVAKQATKATFEDEIDDKIILQIKQPSIDYIMSKLKTSYIPEKANFFAWALEVMKNIIKNQFKKFSKRKVEDTNALSTYVDALSFPHKIVTNKEFTGRLLNKFGKKELTPEQWETVKDETGSSFEGSPERKGDYYIFTYATANDLLNDVLSANKASSSENIVTLCPLYVRNIESKNIKDAIFKSDLKPSGEEKHENIDKITVKGAVITFDKSKFDSDNPAKSIIDVSFTNKISPEQQEQWKQSMVDSNWAEFVQTYDKKRAGDDASLRSKGISNVDNEPTDDEESFGKENEDSFTINMGDDSSSESIAVKKRIDKLKLDWDTANEKGNKKEAFKIERVLAFLEELYNIKKIITVNYKQDPKYKNNKSAVEITSVVDGDGESVPVSDDLMSYLQRRAEKETKEKHGKGEANISNMGSEDQTFDDKDENRLERFKQIMGTPKFIQKFMDTIEGTEDGEGIAERFKAATINKINELKTLNDRSVIKEFYAFLGDLIAESILAVSKPSVKGAKPKMPGIDASKKGGADESVEGNMINIFEKAYESHIEKLSKTLSPDELAKAKEYFKLSTDNLKRISAAINVFMYANAKNKKSTFANMGLDEAKKILTGLMKKTIKESIFNEAEIELDEERISNEAGAAKVNEKENFIGSQVFGEDIGDIGKDSNWENGMYGVFSYGEQFPIYIYTNTPFHDQDGNIKNNDGKFRWFHNVEQYKFDIDKDGEKEVMSSVEKHKELLKPNAKTHGLTTATLENMIKSFKKKNGIKELSHVSILPGEGAGVHYGGTEKEKEKTK